MVLIRPNFPTALAGQLLPFINFLNQLGAPWRSALARAKLPGEITDPSGFVPANGIFSFIKDMASREGLPDLGFLVKKVDCSAAIHPRIIMTIQAAPTLYSALKKSSDQMRLQGSHFQIWLHESNENLWICYAGSAPATCPGAEQGEYFRITRVVEVIRQFLGQDWHPRQLHLETGIKPPASVSAFLGDSEYKTGMPFGAMPVPNNRIGISKQGFLSKAQNTGRSDLRPESTNEDDWLEHIQAVLPAYLSTGGLLLPELAEMTGLSARTLQRLLAEKGTSYRELMDAARFEKARQLLHQNALSATEIAHLSGYTDPTNFARAFRRISGRSPSEYRNDFNTE